MLERSQMLVIGTDPIAILVKHKRIHLVPDLFGADRCFWLAFAMEPIFCYVGPNPPLVKKLAGPLGYSFGCWRGSTFGLFFYSGSYFLGCGSHSVPRKKLADPIGSHFSGARIPFLGWFFTADPIF